MSLESLKLAVISFKECWRDQNGRWFSSGGFPLQMRAISSLFAETSMAIVEVPPQAGGLPLPEWAEVKPMHDPGGSDLRRKISVLLRLPYYLLFLWQHIRWADVVHVPVPGDLPLLALIVALLQRKRLIVRYGGSWTDNSQQTFANRLIKSIMRRYGGGRNLMLATGVGQTPPAPRVRWIFSTPLTQAELDQIQPDLDRGFSNPPRLVYIGRFSTEKGVEYLLRALALLRDQGCHPMPRLDLVGEGPLRGSLEGLAAELALDGLVTFTGQLDRDQLSAHLMSMDLCVQPSLTEGFSKAWLDAFAHGLPVVASNVGAAESVIGGQGDRGWLVYPGDAHALAITLSAVMAEPLDWPDLRRRCRAFAEQYTLEGWAQAIGEMCVEQWDVRLIGGKLTV